MLADNYKYKELKPEKLSLELHPTLKSIVNDIIGKEGVPFLVGGAVLDLLCGGTIKDWDIEVFHISYYDLVNLLNSYGEPNIIGNRFGIVKLKVDDLDLEFSIPRKESKIGVNHKDFDIQLMPKLSIKEAAKRRDFTINALYLNLETKELLDPTGRGLQDLSDNMLDSVDIATFIDDPLRIIRAVQMIARKVRHSSLDLNNDIYMAIQEGQLDNISGEAIYQEFNKMWLLAEPSGICQAMNFIEDTGIIDHFPDLVAMKNTPQKPKYHPEGDVWEHLKLVMTEAARYRDKLPEEWKLAYMWGMFLHDIGKPISVDPETGSMKGHDEKGIPLARAFMEKMTLNKALNDKVCSIVEGHMRPRVMVESSPRKASWRRLQNICRLDILAYVSVADSDGRPEYLREGTEAEWFKHIMMVHEELGKQDGKIPSIVMGRHLIERGMQPSREFGEILKKAYEIQIETGSENVNEILNKVLEGEIDE